MASWQTVWKTTAVAAIAGLTLGLAGPAGADVLPTVKPVAGTPFLSLGAFDLKAMGYVVEEYFISGTATAYKLAG